MKLTDEMLDVLGGANPAGNLLYLPDQLGSKLYQQVDAALNTVGGRWDKARKAHVFPGPAWDAVMELTAQEEITTAAERKQATQFFPTPRDVAVRLAELAKIGPGDVVLEPSAGTGAIAAVIAEWGAAVDCIELDPDYAASIAAAGYARTLTVADFLAVAPRGGYDAVIMNPPFTRGQDVKHVRHALRFVKPGGNLLAVMPAGIRTRGGKAARELRAVIESAGGWFDALPDDAFAESGTNIATVVAVIPAAVARQAGEPARVRTDPTGRGAPLFNAATAKPGTYMHYDAWRGEDRIFAYAGDCISCGRRTWAHPRGDDPRGVFGEHTADPIDSEDLSAELGADVPEDVTYPRCADCGNDYELYRKGLARAVAAYRIRPVLAVPAVAELPAGQLDMFADAVA